MAKSFTNALVGIQVRRGAMDVDAPADVPAWRGAGDPREAITPRHMLHMSSGLANGDSDGTDSSSVLSRMLFGDRTDRMAAFAADVELAHRPGDFWAYSTATSVVLADLIGRQLGGGREEMLAFMRRELLSPTGMTSAVPEFDAAGSFVGGAHIHCTARDYARFGLLYLRDGVWDGRRILPEGWVDFTRTRAPAANNGNYAAHFWLSDPPVGDQFPSLVGAPPSTFSANGNDGQFVIVVPSHDLVVVRLGVLQSTSWPEISGELVEILHTFPDQGAGLVEEGG
jgi:CubicO group peptidase (beta-lactamase class C family)